VITSAHLKLQVDRCSNLHHVTALAVPEAALSSRCRARECHQIWEHSHVAQVCIMRHPCRTQALRFTNRSFARSSAPTSFRFLETCFLPGLLRIPLHVSFSQPQYGHCSSHKISRWPPSRARRSKGDHASSFSAGQSGSLWN